jgi:ParB family chromosome partitioning protein
MKFSTDATMRLVSISENMLRRELTVLEKSVAISDWCAIYRAAQPVMKPGPKPSKGAAPEFSANLALNSVDALLLDASASFSATFSDAAQAFLDVSRRGVFRALKIATIDALQRDRIAFHPLADNQSELTALADQSGERQSAIISIIIGGKAANIEAAIALLDRRPMVTQAAWERFSQKFARLAELEQDRFFELNQAAISRWYATRGGK